MEKQEKLDKYYERQKGRKTTQERRRRRERGGESKARSRMRRRKSGGDSAVGSRTDASEYVTYSAGTYRGRERREGREGGAE